MDASFSIFVNIKLHKYSIFVNTNLHIPITELNLLKFYTPFLYRVWQSKNMTCGILEL